MPLARPLGIASAVAFAVAALAPASALAGTWQPTRNPAPTPNIVDPSNGAVLGPGGASAPMLMTDGRVMFQNSGFAGDGRIWTLTPDASGSYVDGTWGELAQMPYIEGGAAQAVLADGRVLIEGGEYSGLYADFTLTNQGAVYDPVANSWQMVAPPLFFTDESPTRAVFAPHPIGDSASVILPDGTFMLADKMSHQAALLDPRTMTWREAGTATKFDMNDEEGLTLLPSGNVLTIDCYVDFLAGFTGTPYPSDPTNSEIFDPRTGTWSSAGSTIHSLTDPVVAEMGPAILRPDGTVFAVGSPGTTAIYDTRTGRWAAGPQLPISPQGAQYTVQDGPGALLPNGHVLFAATGGAVDPTFGGYAGPPVGFFEFDGTELVAQPTIPNAANDVSGSIMLLPLPSGQILAADGTGDVEIFTPDDRSHRREWEPVLLFTPLVLQRGRTFEAWGIRFNGMSQASAFGDELQNATNYPLVRITSLLTGHVSFARTHDHSSMAVASNDLVWTHYDVPRAAETGLSKLEIVANGIASEPFFVVVE